MPLDQDTRTKITDALELGMPIGNVADYVEIELSALQREIADDPAFKAKVNKAIANCMHKRLQMLSGLKNWQALAFILTSLWPTRFGRNSRGVPKLARLLDPPNLLDFSRLDDFEQRWFDYLMAKLNGQTCERPAERGPQSAEGEPRAAPD